MSLATSVPLGPVTDNATLKPPNPPPSISNLSVPAVPNAFRIRSMKYTPSQLPPEAYYLNAMVTIQAAALGDFESAMPHQIFRSERFREPPVIAMASSMGRMNNIARKHVIWGVYLSMLYMSRARFGLIVFGLEYNDEDSGGISYGWPTIGSESDVIPAEQQVLIGMNAQTGEVESTKSPPAATDSGVRRILTSEATILNQSTSLTLDLSPSPALTTSSNTSLTDLTSRLSVEFTYTGLGLDKQVALRVLLNAITDTTPFPFDAKVGVPWISLGRGENSLVRAQYIGGVPRTEEPFFEYEDLAGALVKAADWMIGNRRYAPFKGVVSVDAVPVGEILLQSL
ncbi:hypothetical protein ACLMJK_001210 [Lecanora helva]